MIHISSLTSELAALLVQNDFLRSESDEQNLRAAREAERRAQADEIRAMHDAADAIRLQAAIQGTTAAVGGAAQCVASLRQANNPEPGTDATEAELAAYSKRKHENEALGRAGCALASVGQASGQLLGGVQKARAETDAAQARHAAESADSRADEAVQHRERVERHADAVLELVEGTLDAEHQGNLAILAKF